ncbi:MAG: DegT/DnrJ/EryC1/StrS family aminotransferase [Mariniphaga sp.]|nr:DegT/DnrJ/EryC1/StrS family aminotransferase [Mariniphaga sp.]
MSKINVGDFKIGDEVKEAINEVLISGRISEGEKVRKFEKEWAKFIGTKYAILINSGTSALISGLTALKHHKGLHVKPNTKVITTPLNYIATSNAIVLSGFEPVYVDIDKKTFGITPENIKTYLEQIDDPTEYSVILPVHLMGYPCDMDAINKIAKEYELITFEDSAQAHGSLYNGKKAGSLSLMSAFSFYIAHNIQAGELGAVVTNDYEIIRLIKKIKANGRMCDCSICTRNTTGCSKMKHYKGNDDFEPRFTHDIIGYNFKAMEFQASLALTQLKKIDWITKKRRYNVKYLNEGLEKYSDILQLPKYDKNVSYLAYPIVIKNPEKIFRKKLRYELEKNGIETRPLFSCIPTQQPAYNYLKNKYEGKLPNAEYVGSHGFYIGCHQYLTQEDLDYIIKQLNDILEKVI